MNNETEGVCLFENWNLDISMNIEVSEQHLLLQDPYDSIWLKTIAILSYFIGLITSTIMLTFINYENAHHGNFRTIINQLVSNLYAIVRKRFALRHSRNLYYKGRCVFVCQHSNVQMLDI